MRRALLLPIALFAFVILPNSKAATTVVAQQSTLVPGHDKDRYDTDNNGIPDQGVTSVGHYTSVYAYDNINWFWDLGDGRVQGTVSSIDELDVTTLTVCNYENTYRAKFENTPFMDSGWIINAINCSGVDDNGSYLYLIVHASDPRYTANPDFAVWGDWEYQVLVISGYGNLVSRLAHPASAVGAR